MQPTRRQLLRWLATSPLVTLPTLARSQSNNEREVRIADVIREYSAQGYHRTGTAVDTVSGAWLSDRMQDLGVPAFMDPVSLQRVNELYTRFAFDGIVMEGVPLHDGRFTDVEGIKGRLGELGSAADIGVIMLPTGVGSEAHERLLTARREQRHRAIVVVNDASYPKAGVALLNAADSQTPFGPPVLQVANTHWAGMQAAMAAQQTAEVVVFAERVPATAYNVSARIEGSDSSLAPIVIMSPRSGWWRGASERGGGLALMLEMMRDLQAAPPARSVIFCATTGHELGYLGLQQMLRDNPSLPAAAAMWIHLGANFGATAAQVRLQYSNDDIRKLSLRSLSERQLVPGIETPTGNLPLGEVRSIHEAKGNYLSLLGNNPLYRHPDDRWPNAVNIPNTAQWTEAFSGIVQQLGRA